MNTYPLIRNRWSNEHLLTAVFIAASLYQLPDWFDSSVAILRYVLIVIAALILEAVINYIRYKKPVCAVSAAVTAAQAADKQNLSAAFLHIITKEK